MSAAVEQAPLSSAFKLKWVLHILTSINCSRGPLSASNTKIAGGDLNREERNRIECRV